MEARNDSQQFPAFQVIQEVKKAVIGKDDCIVKAVAAILAGGHILLNDIPGVGKTTLAMALSKSMSLKQNRVQFTPDVLPSDLTGFSMYQKDTGTFVYQPGSVMCNLLLADEINRTSPKTQSALLEVMEEQKVTVDGRTHEIPSPFIVIATQNPFGSAGTWMLPEAQLDRFMVCLKLGYPSMEDEIDILKGIQKKEEVQTVISSDDLLFMQYAAQQVYVQEELYQYVGNLVNQTRNHPMIDLGLSPRGTINILQMAKSVAFLRQREYLVPEDVKDIFFAVCGHRIMLSAKARAAHMDAEQILKEILKQIKAPRIV
ncbi:MAG: MoxR family ATPase [Lachnospiraceae bacterium]|jgi:MoxR-like ATPase|nr:MoxR family ATPase [Lachnospiraceae bacterium]